MTNTYYVYILTNTYNTVMYIGVTNSIDRRLYEHSKGVADSFTKKYQIHKLMYYETYNDITDAIKREKQLKNWRRDWKMNLIKSVNPTLKDLMDPTTNMHTLTVDPEMNSG